MRSMKRNFGFFIASYQVPCKKSFGEPRQTIKRLAAASIVSILHLLRAQTGLTKCRLQAPYCMQFSCDPLQQSSRRCNWRQFALAELLAAPEAPQTYSYMHELVLQKATTRAEGLPPRDSRMRGGALPKNKLKGTLTVRV